MQDVFEQERPPPSESTSSREDNPELAAMFATEHEFGAFSFTVLHLQSHY